jgi:hypothetical protein
MIRRKGKIKKKTKKQMLAGLDASNAVQSKSVEAGWNGGDRVFSRVSVGRILRVRVPKSS